MPSPSHAFDDAMRYLRGAPERHDGQMLATSIGFDGDRELISRLAGNKRLRFGTW